MKRRALAILVFAGCGQPDTPHAPPRPSEWTDSPFVKNAREPQVETHPVPIDDVVGPHRPLPPSPIKTTIGDASGELGGLTVDEAMRVIRSRAGIYRACYQKELNRSPGIAGTLSVTIQIGGDGVVQKSTVKAGTLSNDVVLTCIENNFARLRFPPRGGIATITMPLTFSSQ